MSDLLERPFGRTLDADAAKSYITSAPLLNFALPDGQAAPSRSAGFPPADGAFGTVQRQGAVVSRPGEATRDAEAYTALMYSKLYAQRAAAYVADRHTDTQKYYEKYVDAIAQCGVTMDQDKWTEYRSDTGEFTVSQALVTILQNVLTGDYVGFLREALDSLEKTASDAPNVKLWGTSDAHEGFGDCDFSVYEPNKEGWLTLKPVVIGLRTQRNFTDILFTRFETASTSFYFSQGKLALNLGFYRTIEKDLIHALGESSKKAFETTPLA